MGKFCRFVASAFIATGLLVQASPVVAAAAPHEVSDEASDVLEAIENPTGNPVVRFDTTDPDTSAPADTSFAEGGRTAVGVPVDELEDYLDNLSDVLLGDLPEATYGPQSRDVRNDDGSHTIEIYNEPTFKQSDAGDWVPLDASVSATDEGAAAPDVLVPTEFGSSGDELLTFEVGQSEVVVSAMGVDVGTPEVVDSTVTYSDVVPGVDYEYVVSPSSVKENILIDSADAPRSYRFKIADPSGALGEATQDGSGGWTFAGRGRAEVPVLKLPAAFAYEAGTGPTVQSAIDELQQRSAHLRVEPVDGGFDVVVTLDDVWAANHEFPIVLDPTWAWGHPGSSTTGHGPQLGARGGLDGTSWKNPSCGQPTTCTPFTSNQYYWAGSIPGSNFDAARSFVRFPLDLASATHRDDNPPAAVNIPMRARIDFSGLWLHFVSCMQSSPATTVGQKCPGTNERGIDVHNMVGSWSAASTWAQLNAAMAATPEDQDAASTIPSGSLVPVTPNNYKVVNEAGGHHSALSYSPPDPVNWFTDQSENGYDTHAWQLLTTTDIVQDWVNDPTTAYGLAIKARNETPQAGTTATGSMWHSSIQDPALSVGDRKKVFPLLQAVWHAEKASKPGNLAPEIAGSTVTAKMDQSTSGTYAFRYDAMLVLADTNVVVAECQNTISNAPTQVLPSERVGCSFPPVPNGRYYLKSTAWNEAGYSDVQTSTPFNVAASEVAGLGYEPWWTFVDRELGPDARASVNVGNGNVVVQQTDGTPIQGHGQLAYVLRRTYNSLSPLKLGLGQTNIGQGWTLNVSTAGDLGAPLAAGLDLPGSLSSIGRQNVTMIDRDGTRHIYEPETTSVAVDLGPLSGGLLQIPAHLQGLIGGPQAATATVQRLLGTANELIADLVANPLDLAGIKVCVDTNYKAPAGVHTELWRYIAIGSGTCSNPTAGGSLPFVLGYGTMNTDRVRQTYAITGQLLSQFDSRGNELRYEYAAQLPGGVALGNLMSVYEPKSCTAAMKCRRFSFSYPSLTQTVVTDPAGRTTTYTLDAPILGQLIRVETKTANGTTVDAWDYTYCGDPKRLCSVTDPRGAVTDSANIERAEASKHRTLITYQADGRVATMVERAGSTTNDISATEATTKFSYDPPGTNPRSTYVERGTLSNEQSQRYFLNASDLQLRVIERRDGTKATLSGGGHLARTVYQWDSDADGPCLQAPGRPTQFQRPDNNLCRITTYADTVNPSSLAAATAAGLVPDGWDDPSGDNRVMDFEYNPEGRVLRSRNGDGTTWLETKYNYVSTYWSLDSAMPAVTVNDTNGVAGSRANLYTATGNPLDPYRRNPIAYVVSDLVSTTTPAGRTTSLTLDNNTTVQPGTLSTTCGQGNTGLVCAEAKVRPGHPQGNIVTEYTYDATFGQRQTMKMPNGGTYRYVYWSDTDNDLSNSVSAGGWLKAIIDPGPGPNVDATKQNAVVFAYDRAGNVARTWDRNSVARPRINNASLTVDQLLGSFTGGAFAPPSGPRPATEGGGTGTLPYSQSQNQLGTASTAFANPGRYVRTTISQVGAKTTAQDIDFNGNVKATRSPRGNATVPATSVYDTNRSFTSRDQLATEYVPASPLSKTEHRYDAAGNQTVTIDPNGNVQKSTFDAANRLTEQRIARGAWASSPAEDCAQGSAPFATNRKVCVTRTYYDGTGQAFLTTNPDRGATWISTDYAGRTTDTIVLRDDDVNDGDPNVNDKVWIRTGTAFDGDGNVVRDCPPTQYEKVPSSNCNLPEASATQLRYSTTHHFDGANRREWSKTYRETVATSTATSPAFVGWDELTTTWEYDENGNVISTQRPDLSFEKITVNWLDRPTEVRSYRTASLSGPYTSEALVHDPTGNLTMETLTAKDEPGQTRTLHTYDAANRPVDTIEAASSTDPVGLVATAETAANVQNLRTRNLYDLDGNVVGQYEPRAFYTTTPDNRYLSRTDFDESGRPVARWTPFYDNTAGPTVPTDGSEVTDCPAMRTNHQPASISGVPTFPATTGICVERRTYDAVGNVRLERNATGSVLSSSSPTTFTNPNRYTEYIYGDNNQVVEVNGPNPALNPNDSQTFRVVQAKYTYDVMGRQTLQADPSAAPSGNADWEVRNTYYFDGLLAGTTEKASAGSSEQSASSYSYDAAGRRTATKEFDDVAGGTFRTDTTSYFADGTVFESTKGAGTQKASTTRYARDPNGYETKVWSPSAVAGDVTNPGRRPTVNSFTSDGLLQTTIEPVDNDSPATPENDETRRETKYDYNRLGMKTQQAVREIDIAGATTQSLPPQKFEYNDNGWVRQELGRNNQLVSGQNTEAITYRYWANGEAYATADTTSGATTTTGLWLNGRHRTVVTAGTSPGGVVIPPTAMTFRYTADGLEAGHASYTDPAMPASAVELSEGYVYNDARKLATTFNWGWNAFSGGVGSWTYTYDRAGRIRTSTDAPVGRQAINSWNIDGTLNSRSVYTTNQADVTNPNQSQRLQGWSYVYDDLNRQEGQVTYSGASAVATFGYAYDAPGRVSAFTAGGTTRSITYDANGNRTRYQHASGQADTSYRADSSLASGASHDAGGRQILLDAKSTAYDGFDRMCGSGGTTCSDAGATKYTYDGLGRKISAISNTATTRIRYVGTSSSLLTELNLQDASKTAKYFNVHGSPLAVANGSATPLIEYAFGDGQGNVALTVLASGSTVTTATACTVRFDPWGSAVGDSGNPLPQTTDTCSNGFASVNSVWYRNSSLDASSGTYAMGARNYQPSQASWMTRDETGAGPGENQRGIGSDPLTLNRYSYVNGDPLNLWDPSGHAPEDCAALGRGVLQCVATGVFEAPPLNLIDPSTIADLPRYVHDKTQDRFVEKEMERIINGCLKNYRDPVMCPEGDPSADPDSGLFAAYVARRHIEALIADGVLSVDRAGYLRFAGALSDLNVLEFEVYGSVDDFTILLGGRHETAAQRRNETLQFFQNGLDILALSAGTLCVGIPATCPVTAPTLGVASGLSLGLNALSTVDQCLVQDSSGCAGSAAGFLVGGVTQALLEGTPMDELGQVAWNMLGPGTNLIVYGSSQRTVQPLTFTGYQRYRQ